MQLLFRTWNHIIPLAIVTNRNLKQGDVVEIKDKKYFINLQPGSITVSGKKKHFYYCVKATNNTPVTNSVKSRA